MERFPPIVVERAGLRDGRRGHRLIAETVIPRPIEAVFAFFSNVENLGRITPSWLSFEIVSEGGKYPTLGAGTMIDYRIRLRGVPLKWRSEITVWEPPRRFVDEQRKGVYTVWIHEHRFRALEDGSTHMTDDVFYSHVGGGLVHRLLVKPDLIRIFRYRQEKLAELMEGMEERHEKAAGSRQQKAKGREQ